MTTKLLLATVLLATVTPAAGQSLADVARAEEARRKAVKGTSKVYTNETLRGADGGQAPAPPAPVTTPEAGTAAKPATKDAALPAGEAVKDEKYWRDRLTAARDALARSQAFSDALQSQINGLYAEFVSTDDPARRAAIEQKRIGALAEQDRVKSEIVKQSKAIADIEDDARRANVPAGWLR